MAKCPYFNEVGLRRNKVTYIKMLCGLTGMPCLVDDQDNKHCMRHEWYQKALGKAAGAPVESRVALCRHVFADDGYCVHCGQATLELEGVTESWNIPILAVNHGKR